MELPALLTPTALQSWIQPHYRTPNYMRQLRIQFVKQQPFPYLELPDFFHFEKAVEIVKALTEELFEPKEADRGFTFHPEPDTAIIPEILGFNGVYFLY